MLELIDRLPMGQFREAFELDDEIAEARADQPENEGEYRTPLRHWNQEVSMLADIIDLLKKNNALVVASAGAKPDPLQPYPRPQTALERVRALRKKKGAKRLSSLVGL